LFDTDGSGTIEIKELKVSFSVLGKIVWLWIGCFESSRVWTKERWD
jgi:hypothetical protein